MMKRKIIYAVLVLLTLFPAVTRDAEFPRFLLAFELLFAAAMAVWVRWMAGKLKAALVIPHRTVVRGERIAIQLRVRNTSWFPAGDIRARLVLRDQGRTDTACRDINAHMGCDSRGTDCWQVDAVPVHCGLVGIEIAEIRISDYIGLCSARVKGPFNRGLVSVLPRIWPVGAAEEPGSFSGTDGTLDAAAAKARDDAQEIFDTRRYQRGDTLRAVHWKLSAKEDDLLVKEFTMPADTALLVAVDSSTEEPEKITPGQLDELLDLTASVAAQLLENGRHCELIWYSDGDQEVHGCRIDGEENLYPALEELLGIRPYAGGGELTSCLDERQPGRREDLLQIKLDGTVCRGDRLIPVAINKKETR